MGQMAVKSVIEENKELEKKETIGTKVRGYRGKLSLHAEILHHSTFCKVFYGKPTFTCSVIFQLEGLAYIFHSPIGNANSFHP